MEFMIKIQCDNQAFEGDGLEIETARIVRGVLGHIGGQLEPGAPMTLMDINGNKVGVAEFIGEVTRD